MGKKETMPEPSVYKGKAIFQNSKDVIPFQAEWENPNQVHLADSDVCCSGGRGGVRWLVQELRKVR